MNAARFSMQFEINYQQNRGKLKKKGSFQTPVYSAMHEFVFYTKAEAVSLVSLLLLYFIIILNSVAYGLARINWVTLNVLQATVYCFNVTLTVRLQFGKS